MSPDQVISALAAFLIAIGAPVALRPMLTYAGVIDVPNERSSHDRPVLRGGGLAQACAIIVALSYASGASSGRNQSLLLVVLATCFATAALGWSEDLHGLPIGFRAGSQFLIGVAAMTAATAGTDHALWWVLVGGVLLLGLVNVVNFMDGVNAISSLHGIIAGCSFFAIGLLHHTDWLVVSGAVLAAAFAAFLPWNITGRMFLGDVGSYLLGGAIAIIVAVGWMEGLPVIALAAPMTIYVADTSVTLVGRIIAREKWYEAHREHTYQRMAIRGASHGQVSALVATLSGSAATLGIVAGNVTGMASILSIVGLFFLAFAYTMIRLRTPKSTSPKSQLDSR